MKLLFKLVNLGKKVRKKQELKTIIKEYRIQVVFKKLLKKIKLKKSIHIDVKINKNENNI